MLSEVYFPINGYTDGDVKDFEVTRLKKSVKFLLVWHKSCIRYLGLLSYPCIIKKKWISDSVYKFAAGLWKAFCQVACKIPEYCVYLP